MISHPSRNGYGMFKFSWKLAFKLVGFGFLLYLLSFLFNHFNTHHYFPIKEVTIVGVHHVDHSELQHIVQPLLKKGFFLIDVSLIKEKLIQFPWVEEASVRRVWPNQVHIQVKEKIPLARWNNHSLLSTTGQIFSPDKSTYPSGIPDFLGPEGQQIEILKNYISLNQLLAPLKFKILRLELMPTQSWRLVFENGMKLTVGRKDVLTKLNHFVKVYPKIVGDHAMDVDYVDLRYPNGLAIRWKVSV